MNGKKAAKDNSELFKWNGNPSIGQILPLATQHVLAAVVGLFTPANPVANAANKGGGEDEMVIDVQGSLGFE